MKRLLIAIAMLGMTGGAQAGDDGFASYFDGSGKRSMAELMSGLRAGGAKLPVPQVNKAAKVQPGNGNNELLRFWEDLSSGVFQDVCKGARIDLSKGAVLDGVGGVQGDLKRYLRQFPDNHIALIDEVGVKLNGGQSFGDVLNIDGNPFNVSFSGRLEGRSVVVRKLDGVKYCSELLTLADLRKVKTVLPITERHISEMKPGEVWKFPAVISMSINGGIGLPIPRPLATISFSLGASEELKPSVTLFKMSEDALRLRIRLDRITVKSAGASAGTTFDAGIAGLPQAESFLGKELERLALSGLKIKPLNAYLGLSLGLSQSRMQGKKILVEFIIDPKNPEQLAKLVDFLRGDLGIIKKLIQMGIRFNDYSDAEDNAGGQAAMQSVSDVGTQGLGLNSTFVGSDHFSGGSSGVSVTLPVILQHNSATGQRYDRYQALGGEEVLHVQNASRSDSDSNLDVPVFGTLMKHNTSQNMYVVNYERKGGAVSDAAVVYQRYEGYIKHDERAARGMVLKMNEILKYAGTGGEGVNNGFTVDVNTLFPRLAAEEANPTGTDIEGDAAVNSKRYKSAIMSFSLVFTKEAVNSMVGAPSATIMKAVFNVMEGLDREIISKVRHLFKVDGYGKVDYDWQAARKLLSSYNGRMDDSFDPMSVVNTFCYSVARITADLAGVRGITDPKAKSERLARVLAGKGKSGLGYEGLMQVLIQLVGVKDIYASLNVQTDKRIDGEANIASTHKVYNESLEAGYSSQLGSAGAMRDRFADPSVLSD